MKSGFSLAAFCGEQPNMGDVYRSDRTISMNDVCLRKEIALKENILLKGEIFYLREGRKMFSFI